MQRRTRHLRRELDAPEGEGGASLKRHHPLLCQGPGRGPPGRCPATHGRSLPPRNGGMPLPRSPAPTPNPRRTPVRLGPGTVLVQRSPGARGGTRRRGGPALSVVRSISGHFAVGLHVSEHPDPGQRLGVRWAHTCAWVTVGPLAKRSPTSGGRLTSGKGHTQFYRPKLRAAGSERKRALIPNGRKSVQNYKLRLPSFRTGSTRTHTRHTHALRTVRQKMAKKSG